MLISPDNNPIRLTLYAGEIFNTQHLHGRQIAIRIISGAAWLSHAGRDMIMTAGDAGQFDQHDDAVLISPARQYGQNAEPEALLLELHAA